MLKKKREVKKSIIKKYMSYIMAIPRNQENISSIDKVIERIKTSNIFEYVGIKNLENPIVLFKYKDKDYSAEIFLESAQFPEMYSINHRFIEDDYDALTKAENGITVGLVFGDSAIESYHMQIKLLNCLVPDILGIVDFSAVKIISGKWAMLAAKSEVPPSPDYLYSVHAVGGEDGEVWLHTHGLNRCGIIELETLGSNKDNYKIHYSVIQALSSIGISNGEIVDEEEPKFIIDFGEDCLVATWVDWEYALSINKKIKTGGANDRKEDHNADTGVIYAYASEEDYKKKKLTHISEYDKMLQENPLIMYTTEETCRMRALALERFDVFAEHYNKEGNAGLIKFGIDVDEEFRDENNQKEHIWFEVKEISGDKIRAVLTQEPYYLNSYKEGEEYLLDKSQVTDWIIYTQEDMITPDSVYIFES